MYISEPQTNLDFLGNYKNPDQKYAKILGEESQALEPVPTIYSVSDFVKVYLPDKKQFRRVRF